MARDLVGTPKKVVLDGNTFFCMADADLQDGKPKWAGEALPHSGGNMWKMTVQSQEASGITLKVNSAELALLRTLAEREDPFPISYVNRAGDTYSTIGWITYENRSSSNGSAEVTMIPQTGWTEFLA